ncbi:MAG: hypothetical protein QOG85_842 [Gaiellaceae bacterium]|jgi:hypothetical protein|nr:hypothetical protein [Gaiellaceae bacterium]
MENISVRRYATPHPVDGEHPIVGTVEPEDRSWILFVRRGAAPMLFLRVSREDGDVYEPACDVIAASSQAAA